MKTFGFENLAHTIKQHKLLILLFFGSVAYFIIWMILSYPYRFFPSDDGYFYNFVTNENIHHALNSWFPIQLFSLIGFKCIWSIFSDNLLQTLLFSTVVSNSITLFFLTLIVFRITKSKLAAILGMVLYGTSAWPVNYYFFYSYTVFSTMLFTCAVFFIIEAYLKPTKKILFISLAGIAIGCLFWSSTSSAVAIALLFLSFLFIFSPLKDTNNKKAVILYSVLCYFVISLFLSSSGSVLIGHLSGNINTDHFTHALKKFEYIPKPPFLSFFHIMKVYNWLLLILFLIVSIFFIVLFLRKNNLLPRIKLLFSLFAIICFHSIIIDVLPFTKLARTHFIVYPIFIIVSVSMLYFVLNSFSNRKKLSYVFSSILFVFVIYYNISFCFEIITVKQKTPKYLSMMPFKSWIFLLKEDPHASYLSLYLKKLNVHIISMRDFIQTLPKFRKTVVLLIGPHGSDSGNSVLKACYSNDFHPENLNGYQLLKPIKRVILPYFSYFPSFLFEEEICQALYFEGKIPNYKLDSKNITLLLFRKKLN